MPTEIELLSCGRVVDRFVSSPAPDGKEWTEIVWHPETRPDLPWPPWMSIRVVQKGARGE